jgi:hypothetical protein
MQLSRENRPWLIAAAVCLGSLVGCVGDRTLDARDRPAPTATSSTEQSVIAVTPPNNPTSSFYLDHPALLFEEIDIWCGNHQSGRLPALGASNNPCAQMCDTRIGFITSTANLATSLFADAIGALPRPGPDSGAAGQLGANLLACGVDAWAIEQLYNDSWCAQNPGQCTIGITANAACCALEFVNSVTVFTTRPAFAGLSAACAGGPMVGTWIEMHNYLEQCRTHILNETSMPISHQQGCMCTRQEIRSNWGVQHACGAPTQWAQVGTAQANCTNHDSDWLPVASAACQGDGASNGSTFYRYSNCQWVTNDQPGWCAFQGAFVGTATNIATGVENACVCAEEERTRNNAFGTDWACSPPRNAVIGTNMGINQCSAAAGDTSWLGAPGAACAAAGRPAGSTWLRRWNCRLETPSSALWPTLGLPAPAPTQVSVAAGPNCPAIVPPPPPPPADDQCAADDPDCGSGCQTCSGSGYGGSGYGSGSAGSGSAAP